MGQHLDVTFEHSVRIKLPDLIHEVAVDKWIEKNVKGRWYTRYPPNIRTATYYFEFLSDSTLFMLNWGEYRIP